MAPGAGSLSDRHWGKGRLPLPRPSISQDLVLSGNQTLPECGQTGKRATERIQCPGTSNAEGAQVGPPPALRDSQPQGSGLVLDLGTWAQSWLPLTSRVTWQMPSEPPLHHLHCGQRMLSSPGTLEELGTMGGQRLALSILLSTCRWNCPGLSPGLQMSLTDLCLRVQGHPTAPTSLAG